mgnify:CR=1 FL=1
MLLTKEQFSELLSLKSITAAAEYLRALPAYKSTFDSADMLRMNRSHLEYLVEQNLIEAYVKFYRFTHDKERRFFAALLREFEVYYLLEAVRACRAGTESSIIYRLPTFFDSHSPLNFGRIFTAPSLPDLLNELAGTEYYSLCAPFLSGVQEFDLLRLESILYNHYYRKLYHTEAEMLDRKDREAFREVISLRADLINMMRIIRTRRFSDVSEASKDISGVLSHLVTLRFRLTDGDLARMIAAETDEDALAVCDSIYPGFAKHFKLNAYEGNLIEYYMRRHAKKLLRGSRASLMTAFGFLMLKSVEIRNIIHAAEAIRYQLPPAAAENLLVF